ncbi:Glyoxylase, beta-lactamase superfamily II [Nakamurella panacisegetis]|uniref:Glyoxylase, beta-lactamase superfamily II n=1 Tax=Nakamurella panacisegetis TaxID=1090615 RepID=A0A1H0QWZ7_9ACTN|nr:MBL fold metallo-hydrolase [Nakamurella panacisegetis]SDP21409.1 Glyoxylase, beta-lactamase superfamily II [Nakamurella panacisegetis]
MFIAGFPAGSFQANCYVIGAERGGDALVVDPGEAATERLADVLREHDMRPVAVLLTHGHLDHMASAAQVCGEADIPAYLHDADEYMLDDPLAGLSDQLREALAGLDLTGLRPGTVSSLADVTELRVAGLTVQVDHTPGHTGGSVVYRFASDGDRPEILLTGDTLFAGSVGRTDLPGGSSTQLMSSIGRHLLTRPDDAVVLPGHGPTSTIGDERRTNPFLN